MKKLLLNATFVALALGSHGYAAQPLQEQSSTSKHLECLKRYNLLPWVDKIDEDDTEEQPSSSTPSLVKSPIAAVSSEHKSNSANWNEINGDDKGTPQPPLQQSLHLKPAIDEKTPQSAPVPSRIKPALMAAALTTVPLAMLAFWAGQAPLSDIMFPADAEHQSTACWFGCDDATARVNNIYRAQQYLFGALATGLVVGGSTYANVKGKVGALCKKIKACLIAKNSASTSNIPSNSETKEPEAKKQVIRPAMAQQEAYQTAFIALKDNLDHLYATSASAIDQTTIDLAWAFRRATDTLYRAQHPNALKDGVDAAVEFSKVHFDGKIASLEKPQESHHLFLYNRFKDEEVFNINKKLGEALRVLRTISDKTSVNERYINCAKGHYANVLKLFHPVASPTECPIEIEISLNQLKAQHPDCYTKIINFETTEEESKTVSSDDWIQQKYEALIHNAVIPYLIYAQENIQFETLRRSSISTATIIANLYITSIVSDLIGHGYTQDIHRIRNLLKQSILKYVNEGFPELSAEFVL